MCKFSIVIPVYNVEPYLIQCVESVAAQTCRDFEIILVDDGSPDGCPAVCDALAAGDSRIRVIHQENQGLSGARNTGIQAACGEYILFLDSDDLWADPDVLQTVAAGLARTDADVLSFNYRKFYGDTPEPLYFPDSLPSSANAESLAQMLQGDRWVTGACNKAIRLSLLKTNQLYFRTGITSEDIDWTLRLALCGQRFAFENVCVFLYRQHTASISHSPSRKKIECLCGNVQECIRLLESASGEKAALLRPFVAYQYGTLLHNVANLPASQRSRELMKNTSRMKWLLSCSNNPKVRLLRLSCRFVGLRGTMIMLRLRQKLLTRSGRGV